MEVQRKRIDSRGEITQASGTVLRYVNPECRFLYEMLRETGLYTKLVSEGLLLEQRMTGFVREGANAYCVMQQEQIPHGTVPSEWSFKQLQDAALATLRVQRLALDYGMVLNDACVQRIQFVGERAKLTDALCFEPYAEGTAWVAYDQFCRHFLAPLLLVKHLDQDLHRLLRVYGDGIPLDEASKMLKNTNDIGTLRHIHWHARSITKRERVDANSTQRKSATVRKASQIDQIESLTRMIENLDR